MRPNTVRLFFFSNGETNDGLCGCSKTFVAFQKKVAQNACLTACRHIADILMDLLLSDDVKSISMGALQQVNLDVIQCERKLNPFYFFCFMSMYRFWNWQNLPLRNPFPVSKKGRYSRPFWTCANCWICCCLGTGQPISTIMARRRASICACPPNEL